MKAQIVHKNNRGEYFYEERDGRSYTIFTQPLVIYPLLRDIIVEIKAYLHYET